MRITKTLNPFILILLSAIGIAGCSSSTGEKSIEPDTSAAQGQMGGHSKFTGVNFDHSVSIDSSEYVMFPLTAQITEINDSSYGSSSRSATYWNIIFYNTATRKYHLLAENSKQIIVSYKGEDSGPGSDLQYSDKFMFYDAVVDDLNKDGVLNTDDPQYLFISDKAGNNFKQISPKGLHVTGWEIIKKTNQVLMATQTDTNGDKKIDDKDKQTPYIYDLKTGAPASPVFSDEFSKGVSALFKKQWPAKK